MLENKVAIVNGTPVSYWENSAGEYNQTVVFFAPSALPGDHFEAFADFFPKNIRIISPDFPGIGKTPAIYHGSIDDSAKLMHAFITQLKLEDSILIGISYGGWVLDKVLGLGNYKKAMLIATGEFYNPGLNLFLRMVFFPPRFSERIRRFYRFIHDRYTHTVNTVMPQFHIATDANLDDLLWLTLAALHNRIDVHQKVEIQMSLVFLRRDKFIGKQSQKKLQSRYINSKTYFLDVRHTFPLNEAEGEQLKAFLKMTLEKEIAS